MEARSRGWVPNELQSRWLAVRLAATALILTAAGGTQAHQHHRWTSADGGSPAYWGVERSSRSYRDCGGWCWTWLSPANASIRQLNPRLRSPSDGHLLEEVGGPPPPPEGFDIWPYSYGPGVTFVPKRYFHWHGFRRGYRFIRWRR